MPVRYYKVEIIVKRIHRHRESEHRNNHHEQHAQRHRHKSQRVRHSTLYVQRLFYVVECYTEGTSYDAWSATTSPFFWPHGRLCDVACATAHCAAAYGIRRRMLASTARDDVLSTHECPRARSAVVDIGKKICHDDKMFLVATALGIAGALLLLRGTAEDGIACSAQSKEGCKRDDRCEWVSGHGCRDIDKQRYFDKTSTPTGVERKQAFCRCVLHVMAKGVQRPYATCARSTGTSTGGKPCHYDFAHIPLSEVRAYARHLEGKGAIAKGAASSSKVRDIVTSWYTSNKSSA